MHHPHRITSPPTTARLGAVVLLALLAAILGCATTGGATRADESSNVKGFKRDFARVAVKKREAGDATGALETWRQGLATYHNQVRDAGSADGKAMKAELTAEWPKLAQALDAKVDDALRAGNPYAAIRVVDMLQFPGGRPLFTVMDDSLILASPAARGWRTRTLNRIRTARNLRGDAKRAASGGHHALAMCLSAGAGDTRTRDQQRAQLDSGGGGDRPSVAVQVSGQDPGVIKAFMPHLERRFKVAPNAKQQILFEVSEAKQGISKPYVYTKQVPGEKVTALSAAALRPDAAKQLNAMLEVDNRLRKSSVNRCEKTDYAECISAFAAKQCGELLNLSETERRRKRVAYGNVYAHCLGDEHMRDMVDYHEKREALLRFLRIRDEHAEVYTRQESTQTRSTNIPSMHRVAARMTMRLKRDNRTLFNGQFAVNGVDGKSADAALQLAGKNLANVTMIRINQHFGARPGVTDAVLKAPPGPAPANAFLHDMLNRLSLNKSLSNLERAYVVDLCGLNATSIYNDSKLKGALGL